MVTRVRIEAHGASAAEVEAHLNAVASAIRDMIEGVGDGFELGQMVIQREEGEPAGHTAFSGRGLLYLNVASDAGQVGWLRHNTGTCTTLEDGQNHWSQEQIAARDPFHRGVTAGP